MNFDKNSLLTELGRGKITQALGVSNLQTVSIPYPDEAASSSPQSVMELPDLMKLLLSWKAPGSKSPEGEHYTVEMGRRLVLSLAPLLTLVDPIAPSSEADEWVRQLMATTDPKQHLVSLASALAGPQYSDLRAQLLSFVAHEGDEERAQTGFAGLKPPGDFLEMERRSDLVFQLMEILHQNNG